MGLNNEMPDVIHAWPQQSIDIGAYCIYPSAGMNSTTKFIRYGAATEFIDPAKQPIPDDLYLERHNAAWRVM